jgi:hypothetical protein
MRRGISVAALVLVLAALAQAASITVTQIKASGEGGAVVVDPRLSEIKEDLLRKFRFSKYTFLSRSSASVSTGKTASWDLTTGDILDITLESVDPDGRGQRYTITVEVYYFDENNTRQNIITTTVKVPAGQTFLLGLGEYKDLGGTFILALRTQ